MDTFSIKTNHLDDTIRNAAAGLLDEVLAARQHLIKGDAAGNDFLGWVNLPEEQDTAMLQRLKADVARLTAKSRVMVVVGIGGSYSAPAW